jgi:hypothetical protein
VAPESLINTVLHGEKNKTGLKFRLENYQVESKHMKDIRFLVFFYCECSQGLNFKM